MANIRDEMVLGNKLEVGLTRTRDTFDPKHPIEVSEKNFRQDDSGLCRTPEASDREVGRGQDRPPALHLSEELLPGDHLL